MDGAEEVRKLSIGAFTTHAVQVAGQRKRHASRIDASGLHA